MLTNQDATCVQNGRSGDVNVEGGCVVKLGMIKLKMSFFESI